MCMSTRFLFAQQVLHKYDTLVLVFLMKIQTVSGCGTGSATLCQMALICQYFPPPILPTIDQLYDPKCKAEENLTLCQVMSYGQNNVIWSMKSTCC